MKLLANHDLQNSLTDHAYRANFSQFLKYSNFTAQIHYSTDTYIGVCLPVANTKNRGRGKKGQNGCSTYYHNVASATVTKCNPPSLKEKKYKAILVEGKTL